MTDPHAPETQTQRQRQDLFEDGSLTVDGAIQFSGLGRTRLYELMNAGELPY